MEITKIALWVETFIFGTPLSFIEHHIKCGNSLLYTTIDSFKEFESKELKQDLFARDLLDIKDLEEAYEKISSLNDTTKGNIEKSKEIYRQTSRKLKELNNYLNFLNYYDFKHANKERINAVDAFELFQSRIHEIETFNAELSQNGQARDNRQLGNLESSSQSYVVVEEKNTKKGNNKTIYQFKIEDFIEFVEKYKPFNIEIEFPDTKKFNVVVGNPPWEVNKFREDEFFARYQSNYGRALSHGGKRKVRENLFVSSPHIKTDYQKAQNFIKNINEYYKIKFPHNKGSGDSNLYMFFLERNLQLLKPQGTMYYLTPSLWVFADSGINIRQHIFKQFQLSNLFMFYNKNKIFPIDSNYKFCIFQINNEEGTKSIQGFFIETDVERLTKTDSYINLSLNEIKIYAPATLSILKFPSNTAKSIIFRIYPNFMQLKDDYVVFNRELDMTFRKSIMDEINKEGLIPLYEGKTIDQFNSKFSNFKYFVDSIAIEKAFSGNKNKININKQYCYKYIRLVIRDISGNTNQRTLISSLIPKDSITGDTLSVSVPNNTTTSIRLLFTQAIFNSIIADYIMRMWVDVHVSLTYLKRLPMPKPTDEEIKANSDYSQLVYNSALLTYLYNPEGFSEFKEEFKLNTSNYPKTAEAQQRYLDNLRIENDVITLKIYGITPEELNDILETFKVLNNKNPQYISLLKQRYQEYYNEHPNS